MPEWQVFFLIDETENDTGRFQSDIEILCLWAYSNHHTTHMGFILFETGETVLHVRNANSTTIQSKFSRQYYAA